MGIPWNPDWDREVRRILGAPGALTEQVAQILADGSTLSLMTPGSIPSGASTNAVEDVVVDTDAAAAHITLSTTTGSWQRPSPPVGLTVRHGGRPILVLAIGSVFPASDEARFSFLVDGQEVTNTVYGLVAHRPNGGAWEPLMVGMVHRPQRPGTVRFDLASYRASAAGAVYLLSYTGRFTLLAVEV